MKGDSTKPTDGNPWVLSDTSVELARRVGLTLFYRDARNKFRGEMVVEIPGILKIPGIWNEFGNFNESHA